MIATDRLLTIFVDAADTLVADFDVIDFLHHVVDNTSEIVGTDAVGLLLADEDRRLHFMAGTSGATRNVELFQIQSDEGPCHDCFVTHEAVVVPDLSAAVDRWPVFVPHALDQGVRAVHAFPLRLRDQTIGALNVFGSEPLPLTAQETSVVQSLADIATIGIIQERAIRAALTLTEQLQSALNSRIVIEQAKGAVAQSLDVPVDEAFTLLSTYARNHGRRLVEVGRDVADRTLDPATLTTDCCAGEPLWTHRHDGG